MKSPFTAEDFAQGGPYTKHEYYWQNIADWANAVHEVSCPYKNPHLGSSFDEHFLKSHEEMAEKIANLEKENCELNCKLKKAIELANLCTVNISVTHLSHYDLLKLCIKNQHEKAREFLKEMKK